MRSRVADLEARLMPSRIPFASLALLAAATGLLWPLCLPVVPLFLPDVHHLSEVFEPRWLVLATLLAMPLKRVAAWRCWVGLLGLVLVSVLSLAITAEAVARVHAIGLDVGVPESLWMPLSGCQVLLFLTATVSGLRERLFVRRWQRLVRMLAVNKPQPLGRTTRS